MFLEIKGLKKGFGSGDSRTEVLRGIDFSVEKGEFCVLLGPSGSGKSTLLNIIGGIDEPDEGYISINGDKNRGYERKGPDPLPQEASWLRVPDVQSDPKFKCQRKH